MRSDISKVISERQRGGSSERSQKTRLKLNPNYDYDSNDYDWGPTHFSSARHRQEGHGRYSKRQNENLRPLIRFLKKSIGRSWDDIYSEICHNVDPRSTVGFRVIQHVGWVVANDVVIGFDGKPYHCKYGHSNCEYTGFYIHPETGLLCENRWQRFRRIPEPITSIHWYENVWFKLEVLKRVAKCGCIHFKVPTYHDDGRPSWRTYPPESAVCFHGNEPIPQPIWYVIEYKWHDPDEIYKVFHWEDNYARTRFNLKEPGDKHILYYRDVPEILKKPVIVRKKVANHKELILIKKALENTNISLAA